MDYLCAIKFQHCVASGENVCTFEMLRLSFPHRDVGKNVPVGLFKNTKNMAYEHKPGTGSLFKNDKAGDNPKAPMYKGKFMTNSGELIDLALWVQETKSGLKYFSVKQSAPFSAPVGNDRPLDVSGYQPTADSRSNATPAALKSIPMADDLPF